MAATRARSPRRPRATSLSSGIGDTAYFGPEAEFFVFDDVRYKSAMKRSMYSDRQRGRPLCQRQGSSPTATPATARRSRAAISRCRRSTAPYDLRAEMLSVMAEMGLKVEKHHHEVAPAQHELGFEFDTLVKTADSMQIYKYVVHNVAAAIRQDRDLHAQADQGRQRLGHARPPVDLERRASRCSRARATPTCRRPRSTTSAASSSTPRRSTPSPTRPPTATSA